MKQELLNKIENIINTLTDNEIQTIEIRSALIIAQDLKGMLTQIDDMHIPSKKEEIKEEPTKWVIPRPTINNNDKKTKE